MPLLDQDRHFAKAVDVLERARLRRRGAYLSNYSVLGGGVFGHGDGRHTVHLAERLGRVVVRLQLMALLLL